MRGMLQGLRRRPARRHRGPRRGGRPAARRGAVDLPGPVPGSSERGPLPPGRLGRRIHARPAGDLAGARHRPSGSTLRGRTHGPPRSWPAAAQWPAAEAHVSAAQAAAERFPLVIAVAAAATAAASLASARGDLAGVLRATEPVRATGLLGVGGRPGIFNWRAIEADALIGLGRLDEAETALREFEAAIPADGLASAALALARCQGNLAVAERERLPGGSGVHPRPSDRGTGADAVRARSAEPRRRPPPAGSGKPAGGGRAARAGPPACSPPWEQTRTCRPAPPNWRLCRSSAAAGSPAALLGLSRAELAVARLVATGLTNREVASRAVRVGKDRGVPPPQQLHQARHHLPPGTGRSAVLTGPVRFRRKTQGQT